MQNIVAEGGHQQIVSGHDSEMHNNNMAQVAGSNFTLS